MTKNTPAQSDNEAGENGVPLTILGSFSPASRQDSETDTQDSPKIRCKKTKKTPRQGSPMSSLSVSTTSPQAELTEEDLANQRERLLKTKAAREMLETGFSIRDVVDELKLPKGYVEKLSKAIRREEVTPSSARAEYLARPFKYANEKLKESEDEDESLLDSGWIVKTQRKLLKLKIEQDMMKRMGLLGDDNNSGAAGKLDLQQLLLAKIVSGGQNGQSLNAKELTEFAGALKNLFSPNNNQDPIQAFTQLSEIQQKGLNQYKEIAREAAEQAKNNQNRGLIREAIDVVAPLAQNLLKNVPTIPKPTEIPDPMVPPGKEELDEINTFNKGEIISVSSEPQVESFSLSPEQGYSNLEAIRSKTTLRGE